MRSHKSSNFATAATASITRSRQRKSPGSSKPPKIWARSVALLYGDEWPQVKMKNMTTGEQELVAHDHLLAHLQAQSSLSS